MARALKAAENAVAQDEVPVGAVIVKSDTGRVVSVAYNKTRTHHDPSAHAEILAIREACKIFGTQRIPNCDLYVTLEPCTMCAGAISFARVNRLIIGAPDPKGGGVLHGAQFFEQPTCHHKPQVIDNVMAQECGDILKVFFKEKRAEKRKAKSMKDLMQKSE